jgi:cytochrome c553
MRTFQNLLLISSLAFTVSCFREMPSENTPIHLILNMDDQEKFEPFEKNTFFKDESAMRMPVEGTIARDDDLAGMDHNIHTMKNPLPLSSSVMERGKQRYNIYCTPCHGAVGDGKGIVAQRGMTLGFVPPTNLHDQNMRNMADGHFYHVMTNGIRNMQPYAYQINENDRWAIVHYIRALQRSQNASAKDIPVSVRDKVK